MESFGAGAYPVGKLHALAQLRRLLAGAFPSVGYSLTEIFRTNSKLGTWFLLMAIPRLIHQTARDYDSLPAEVKNNIGRTRALNPDWDYRFYSDQQILDYVKEHGDERMLRACERINPLYGVVLADFFRYLVMYREGGVYLDIKSTMWRPLNDILLPDDSYLISQWNNRLCDPYANWGLHQELSRIPGGELQQWYIVAAPGHPFLDKVIRDVLFNMEYYHPGWHGVGSIGVLRVAGPICYSLAIAPLLLHFPFRFVDIENAGFGYSIYGSKLHHQQQRGHYSNLSEPVILPSP